MKKMNEAPICPVCGEECRRVFVSIFDASEVIGCDNCISEGDAYEWAEENESNEEDLWDEFNHEGDR